MATWSDAFQYRDTYLLELVLTENSVNTSANTSSVTGTLQFNPPSNAAGYNLFSSQNSYSFTFNGTTYTGNFTWDFRTSQATKVLKTVTATISHAANGTGSVSASGSATIDDNDNASISTKTLTLTDISRPPAAPSSGPTLSRSSDGLTVTVTSATASSAVSVSDYEAQYQASGASTWTTVSLGTNRTGNISVGSATNSYIVQTRAISSEGTGPWSASATIVGLPTAPATITATRTGRSVTVVAGTSTGTGITGYSVQYSSNGGSTWSTAQAMTSQSYTYSSLTAGQTYLFRVYSTNSIGNSDYATSAALFVPAGGRRYDGSTFTPTTTAKRWDGSAWVDITTAKRWNGSTWADLT